MTDSGLASQHKQIALTCCLSFSVQGLPHHVSSAWSKWASDSELLMPKCSWMLLRFSHVEDLIASLYRDMTQSTSRDMHERTILSSIKVSEVSKLNRCTQAWLVTLSNVPTHEEMLSRPADHTTWLLVRPSPLSLPPTFPSHRSFGQMRHNMET